MNRECARNKNPTKKLHHAIDVPCDANTMKFSDDFWYAMSTDTPLVWQKLDRACLFVRKRDRQLTKQIAYLSTSITWRSKDAWLRISVTRAQFTLKIGKYGACASAASSQWERDACKQSKRKNCNDCHAVLISSVWQSLISQKSAMLMTVPTDRPTEWTATNSSSSIQQQNTMTQTDDR